MIRNLIFDWSGTLADDFSSVLHTTNRMLEHYGREVMSESQFRSQFRLPFTEFYQEVLPEISIEEIQILYLQHFPTEVHVPLIEYAQQMLEYAALTGRRLALLSSAPSEHFHHQATATGVRDFFERAHCGVVDKRIGLQHLLEELDMAPEETAFVGDMRHDLDAARAAGTISIAVATGYESVATLMQSEPDVLLQNLCHLPTLLGGWEVRDKQHPVSTVGALLIDQAGQLLMIRTHKWSHRWGIPGGKIKRGETCEQALRREIEEETGLHMDTIQFVMIQDCIDPPEFQRSTHFLLLNYLATCSGTAPEVHLNDEAQAYCWLRLEDAMRLDLNQPTRILLEECQRRGMI